MGIDEWHLQRQINTLINANNTNTTSAKAAVSKMETAKEMAKDEKEKCFIRCAWSADVSFNFNEFSIRLPCLLRLLQFQWTNEFDSFLRLYFFFSSFILVFTSFSLYSAPERAAIPHRTHERVHFNLCFSNVVNSSGIKTDENILTQKFN